MREIKFKVYDNTTKQMSPEFVLFGEFLLLGAIHAWQHDSGNQAESSLEALNDLTVIQYTGLKDCEGKDIFESDILTLDGTKYMYEVRYEDAKFVCYHIGNDYGKWGDLHRFYDPDFKDYKMRIVGNIHQAK